MNRRKALKTIGILSSLILLNKIAISAKQQNKKLHIIGFGGAGNNMLEYIHKKGVLADYTCISNPIRNCTESNINFIQFIQPGKHYKFNNTSFHIPDMDKDLIIPQEIINLFKSDKKYVLLAGIGGYTGTKMIENLSLHLHKKNIEFTSIATIPLSYEGKLKKEYANNVINNCKHINSMNYINLDELRNKIGNTLRSDFFNMADETAFDILYQKSIV
jgi:cell division GTPase FtsZ